MPTPIPVLNLQFGDFKETGTVQVYTAIGTGFTVKKMNGFYRAYNRVEFWPDGWRTFESIRDLRIELAKR